MRNLLLALSLLALSACGNMTQQSSLASADDWSHSRLRSDNGADISLDFRAIGLHSGSYVANPVWINVTSPKLSGNEKVQVTLVQALWRDPSNLGEEPVLKVADTMVIDLAFAGNGRFTGVLHDSVSLNQIGSIKGYLRQQLSITSNGQTLKDPISGRASFMLNMACAAEKTAWMCR